LVAFHRRSDASRFGPEFAARAKRLSLIDVNRMTALDFSAVLPQPAFEMTVRSSASKDEHQAKAYREAAEVVLAELR